MRLKVSVEVSGRERGPTLGVSEVAAAASALVRQSSRTMACRDSLDSEEDRVERRLRIKLVGLAQEGCHCYQL